MTAAKKRGDDILFLLGRREKAMRRAIRYKRERDEARAENERLTGWLRFVLGYEGSEARWQLGAGQSWIQWHEMKQAVRAALAAAQEPPAEKCGSFGCTLPAGHNIGRADVPSNHLVKCDRCGKADDTVDYRFDYGTRPITLCLACWPKWTPAEGGEVRRG